MNANKHWYAIYTKPRWEKKVHALLLQKGFESYCPLQKLKKQWSDRIKLVEEPLFKSYVFVKLSEKEITTIRMVAGVVNFVYWLGKPAVIKVADIERIKRFLNEYEQVMVTTSPSWAPNTKVLITSGALMDKTARVIKDHKKRVELVVESLGCTLVAIIEKEKLVLA